MLHWLVLVLLLPLRVVLRGEGRDGTFLLCFCCRSTKHGCLWLQCTWTIIQHDGPNHHRL